MGRILRAFKLVGECYAFRETAQPDTQCIFDPRNFQILNASAEFGTLSHAGSLISNGDAALTGTVQVISAYSTAHKVVSQHSRMYAMIPQTLSFQTRMVVDAHSAHTPFLPGTAPGPRT